MSGASVALPARWRLRWNLGDGRLTLFFGLAIVLGWGLLALLAPWVAPYDPLLQNSELRLVAPSLAHPFGTDNFGRDILSRVIAATRTCLLYTSPSPRDS